MGRLQSGIGLPILCRLALAVLLSVHGFEFLANRPGDLLLPFANFPGDQNFWRKNEKATEGFLVD
jgi:hypothetical protein